MLENLEWPHQDIGNIELGLDRLQAYLDILGNPERHLPPTIHIAGTNGKGSTSAFIQALLRQQGHSTHVYRSPHLLYWNERIVINDAFISDSEFLSTSRECQEAAKRCSSVITHFEALTALAFLAFSRHPADFLILEVGLGGRLDATNIIPSKSCAVITTIGMDHAEFLGNSITEIATEKAHIMRSGVPCISAKQSPEALQALHRVADSLGCELLAGNELWQIQRLPDASIEIEMSRSSWRVPPHLMPLAGAHQSENLALALATISYGLGLVRSQKDLLDGLGLVSWPGRLQKVDSRMIDSRLSEDLEVWVDVAHNPDGAEAVSQWLKEQDQRPLTIITELSRNRCYHSFLNQFEKEFQDINVYVPSALPPERSKPSWNKFRSLDELFTTELREKVRAKERILVCGSHRLVSECLRLQHLTPSRAFCVDGAQLSRTK
jgi:dihydrofolate synthase/folylpolyglutamate synthase